MRLEILRWHFSLSPSCLDLLEKASSDDRMALSVATEGFTPSDLSVAARKVRVEERKGEF